MQLGQGGLHAESPGMAWMEGFADYFARAVALAFGSKISMRPDSRMFTTSPRGLVLDRIDFVEEPLVETHLAET